MKAVKRICAFIIGLVFFVAGFLKLMDPVGASLVVEEYFKFLHLGFLIPFSRAFGVGMALFETLLGAVMLAGVWPAVAACLSGLVLLGFTALTFVLWTVNPAMDCGCFGEAVHLTHFQSFIKNVALCVLWLAAYIPFKSVPRPKGVKYVSFSIAALSIVAFTVWAQKSIPAMDFTAFKPGETLMQAQSSPSPGSPLLSICNASGDYCDELLAEGQMLVVSAYDFDSLSPFDVAAIDKWREAMPVPVYVLVTGADGPWGSFTADRRTLMTLNRSNGGATLLSDGLIVSKWPLGKLPSAERVGELVAMDPTEAMVKENTPQRLKLQGFLLYVTAVLLLL
ncbi:MAG: hypothetical protein IKZ91_03580 [Bacteroidales bacterium]|nr:hypothetical protein [Bacteroidales bacterium]